MLERLNALRGGPVLATDGEIGKISDFYFDDETWTIRHMVVDTGAWLPGRRVLIPLWALRAPDWRQVRVPVRLTRDQVRESPDVDTERPVSRAAEARALAHFGYPYYWGGPALWGPVPAPGMAVAVPPVYPVSADDERAAEAETHLRSCREVTGYHLRALDGEIGHVDDFVVDAATWRIEDLLVDTSNWIGGRAVLVRRSAVAAVSWAERIVEITLDRHAVANSPGTPTRTRPLP